MEENKLRKTIRDEIITVYKISYSADYDSLIVSSALGLAVDKIYSLIDRSDSEGQVKAEVMQQTEYVTKKEFDAMAEVVKHHSRRIRQLEEKIK